MDAFRKDGVRRRRELVLAGAKRTRIQNHAGGFIETLVGFGAFGGDPGRARDQRVEEMDAAL